MKRDVEKKVQDNEKNVTKKDKIISIISKIIIAISITIAVGVVVCFICYIYNNIHFTNVLKENGYETSNNTYFRKSDGDIEYKIEIDSYNIFSIPDFVFSKRKINAGDLNSIEIALIEFHDINNENKNLILPTQVPTNIATGQKMTLSELKAQLDVQKEGYIINYSNLTGDANKETENVTRDEWLKVSKDYISGVEEAYNEVVNMFK